VLDGRWEDHDAEGKPNGEASVDDDEKELMLQKMAIPRFEATRDRKAPPSRARGA
jgi:hypothetical protein